MKIIKEIRNFMKNSLFVMNARETQLFSILYQSFNIYVIPQIRKVILPILILILILVMTACDNSDSAGLTPVIDVKIE